MNNAALRAIRSLGEHTQEAPKTPKRITKATIGSEVIWHGYDGKKYRGKITNVRRYIATVSYYVGGLGAVNALVDTRVKEKCAHVEFI